MDTKRRYRNAALEARRKDELRRAHADELMRSAKVRARPIAQQVSDGLTGEGTGELASAIVRAMSDLQDVNHAPFERLLRHLAKLRSPLLENGGFVAAFGHLAQFSAYWLRDVEAYKARSHNSGREFGALLRFLLARYDMPGFFDSAWQDESDVGPHHRKWFIHVAMGNNWRTADDLPFPLTKAMAHHALQAPATFSVLGALRYGQTLALGGSRRIAEAIVASRLGSICRDEAFALDVIRLFATAAMVDPNQVSPIIDYVFSQKFDEEPAYIADGVVRGGEIPQPGFSMKGRTVESLIRQTENWHCRLAQSRKVAYLIWKSCGISGMHRVEGVAPNQQLWVIRELTNSEMLRDEGRAMHHCVASCASSCAQGRAAIFTLSRDAGSGVERRITIELSLPSRTIVQARGRYNAASQPLDERVIRAWAMQAGLKIASYAFSRAF